MACISICPVLLFINIDLSIHRWCTVPVLGLMFFLYVLQVPETAEAS